MVVEAVEAPAVKEKVWETLPGPDPVSVQLLTVACVMALAMLLFGGPKTALAVPLALGSGF